MCYYFSLSEKIPKKLFATISTFSLQRLHREDNISKPFRLRKLRHRFSINFTYLYATFYVEVWFFPSLQVQILHETYFYTLVINLTFIWRCYKHSFPQLANMAIDSLYPCVSSLNKFLLPKSLLRKCWNTQATSANARGAEGSPCICRVAWVFQHFHITTVPTLMHTFKNHWIHLEKVNYPLHHTPL